MRFCRILLASLLAISVIRAEDAPTADDLWKKTEDALNAVINPKPATPPASQEEFAEWIKGLITAADAAGKEFTDKYPHDPRRWRVRVLDAMTASGRAQLGLPDHGRLETIVKEVLDAPDADAQAKGQADALRLLVSSESVAAGVGDADAWAKEVEEHLKKYPDLGMGEKMDLNKPLEAKVTGIKVLAELKTKPLDLKFKALDGTEVDLAKMRGKVVLVDFWATWCGPCVGEVPNVVKTYEKLHSKGFDIVGISLDRDQSKLEAFTKENGMTWPQYFDGKFWENDIVTRFGIRSIPAMWLVDKKGMVVSIDAREQLEELVEKYLAE